eukprot:SAG25_NODE_4565_length_789_cov_1.034783_2_plen_94_part_00
MVYAVLSDLLRHPWTVGSGNPEDFDRLIEQMDDMMMHDPVVARKLEQMVNSKQLCVLENWCLPEPLHVSPLLLPGCCSGARSGGPERRRRLGV